MTTIRKIIIIVTTLGVFCADAQDFQGVATYKTKRSVALKLDSTQMNLDTQKQMIEMLKKRFQKTFKLSFNKQASVYKEDESLAPPQVGRTTLKVMMIGSNGGGDILYKNTKNNTFSDQKDVLGKIFLVKDKLKPYDWKLESGTKNIGEYTCYKATFTREVEVLSSISFSGSSKVKGKTTDRQMETQTVTAWYTPQIPVNNGPENYYGLPGLILEINTGEQQIVCSKIVLNPKDKIDIKEPTKGKIIDQAEYEEIMEKKRKEMMERYAPKNGGREGESIQIKIGG